MLETHWGVTPDRAELRPLASASQERPLSHTSGLWRVNVQRAPDGAWSAFVLKAQLTAAALRPVEFHVLKRRVMERCARRGIPVAIPVPATDGAPVVRHDGVDCELAPLLPGTAQRTRTPAQAAGIVATGLALRTVLDGLPEDVLHALAPHPVNPLVAEERWQVALDDALGRLLPMAARRTDEWGQRITLMLRQLADVRPLLAPLAAVGDVRARGTAVVHGDLHHHHFLVDDVREGRVTGVLDFDNMRLDDRLLDLAWLAVSAGRVTGTRAARYDSTAAFVRAAGRSGLLAPDETGRLMPVLLAYGIPVVVDIAKDILERDLLDDLWIEYLDLLSPDRMAQTHALLIR